MIAADSMYRRVTRGSPCAVCGKTDWCRASADGAIALCNRIASDRPARGEGGGWLHRVGDVSSIRRETTFALSTDRPKLSTAELMLIDRQGRADLTPARLDALARNLTVSARSLRAFGVGWRAAGECFTFPMRDADGRIVGIRTRQADGTKRCVAGSRLGLIVPEQFDALVPDWLLVCEGESDAAAALDLGFHAVGRPGCETCAQTIVAYVERVWPVSVAVLADADAPGQRGGHALARRIAQEARAPARVLTLPDGAKDLRVWKATPDASHHALHALLDAPARRAT